MPLISDCTPPALNDLARLVRAPAKSGPGACTPLSLGRHVGGHGVSFQSWRNAADSPPSVCQSAVPYAVPDGVSDHQIKDVHRNDVAQQHHSGVPQQSPGHFQFNGSQVHASSKKSNLDSTGRAVVKKGVTVSYHGLRMSVVKVRAGYCWATPLNVFGKPVDGMQQVLERCALVQVVS